MNFGFILNSLAHIGIGYLIGCGFGITGIGAGVLAVPVLIHIFGLSPVYAVGTGLVFASLAKIGATIYHFRLGTIRLRRSFYFLLGSVPAVLFASTLVNYLGKILGSSKIDQFLKIFTGIIIIFSSLIIVFQLVTQDQQRRQIHIAQSRVQPVPFSKKALAIFFGFIIGSLIGITSVGSGVLMIPILMGFLDASAKEAVGTSIFISVFLAFLGSLVYFSYGHVNILSAILLSLGAIPGVRLGSQLISKISESTLIIIVAAMVLISGISMFL